MVSIEAIKRVKARYCRYVDGQDWRALRGLFADDVAASFASEGKRVFTYSSADDCVGAIEEYFSRLATSVTVHHCHTPEIDVDGATGRATWAMEDYVDRLLVSGERRAFRGYGHYFEEYRQHGDVWLITSIRLTRIRVDHLDPALLPPFPAGRDGAP